MKPLRRRAALLIGAWVADLKSADKPVVYQAIVSLMTDDDEAIALTGFNVLHNLVDDWGFIESDFLEYVEPSFCSAALEYVCSSGQQVSQPSVSDLRRPAE